MNFQNFANETSQIYIRNWKAGSVRTATALGDRVVSQSQIPPVTGSRDVSINLVIIETVYVQWPAAAERWSSRDQQRFRDTRPWVACGAEEDVEGAS